MATKNNNKPPRQMLKTKESKAFYQQLIEALDQDELFSEQKDQLLLSLMAEQYHIYKQALDEVHVNGAWTVQTGDQKQPRLIKTPAVAIVAEQAKFLRDCLKELALTPKSRASIKIEQQQAATNELEAVSRLYNKGIQDD